MNNGPRYNASGVARAVGAFMLLATPTIDAIAGEPPTPVVQTGRLYTHSTGDRVSGRFVQFNNSGKTTTCAFYTDGIDLFLAELSGLDSGYRPEQEGVMDGVPKILAQRIYRLVSDEQHKADKEKAAAASTATAVNSDTTDVAEVGPRPAASTPKADYSGLHMVPAQDVRRVEYNVGGSDVVAYQVNVGHRVLEIVYATDDLDPKTEEIGRDLKIGVPGDTARNWQRTATPTSLEVQVDLPRYHALAAPDSEKIWLPVLPGEQTVQTAAPETAKPADKGDAGPALEIRAEPVRPAGLSKAEERERTNTAAVTAARARPARNPYVRK